MQETGQTNRAAEARNVRVEGPAWKAQPHLVKTNRGHLAVNILDFDTADLSAFSVDEDEQAWTLVQTSDGPHEPQAGSDEPHEPLASANQHHPANIGSK